MRHGDRGRARWLVPLGLGAALALGTAACGSDNENGQNTLDPSGPRAQQILDLFTPVFWVGVVIGLAVLTATVVFAFKFRYRPGTNENPKQVHGSTPLEIGWTIVPALILAVVAVPTVATIFDLAETPKGDDVFEVTATGKQWWWEFQYPDAAVVTANELHIPVGRPVVVTLEATDVIHSFWVPELAGKQDVVPGRNQETVIEASEPGTYLGQCAEYCGLSHANMRFRVIAQSPADFEEWLAGQQEGPREPYEGEIVELTGSKYGCVNCHIFDDPAKTNYGPNLVHLDTRETFAGSSFEVGREDLTEWILNAPGMLPMQAEDCRLPPPATCVGMPSFTENTPEGQPVMTPQDAATIVDYLIGPG